MKYKLCIECRYHEKYGDLDLCHANPKNNVIDGSRKLRYCENERTYNTNDSCTLEALWFEPTNAPLAPNGPDDDLDCIPWGIAK